MLIFALLTQTMQFEYISESVASGLMSVGVNTQTPTVYGVLNSLNEDQVKARSSADNTQSARALRSSERSTPSVSRTQANPGDSPEQRSRL